MQQELKKQEYSFLSKLTDAEMEIIEDKIENGCLDFDEIDDDSGNSKNIWWILGGSIIILTLLMIFLKPPAKYWVIGITGCVVFTILEVILIECICSCFDEEIYYRINSCLLLLMLIGNIVLRIRLGEAVYFLLFRIFEVWIMFAMCFNIIGGLANDCDFGEICPNLVIVGVSVLLFFFWPWDFTWNTWQWIISVGGGIIVTGSVVFLAYWLYNEKIIDLCDSLSVMYLILSIVNIVLLFSIGEKYIFICKCFMGLLLSGSIINLFLEGKETRKWLSFILAVINGSVLLMLFSNLYPQLNDAAEWLIKLIKGYI